MRTVNFPSQEPMLNSASLFPSASDDLPSFDDTFNINFLKKFYSKSESWSTQSLFPSDPFEDVKRGSFTEVMFPFSPETQTSMTSPSMNNHAKYDQKKNKKFNIHLEEKFNSESTMMNEEVFRNLEDNYLESMQATRSQSLNVPSNSQSQMSFSKPNEIKKISGVTGNLNMTMTIGGITLKKGVQSAPMVTRMASEPVRLNGMHPDARFEALLKSKRIFKIEKDTKPKVSAKLNAALHNKPKNQQQSPLRVPLNNVNISYKAPMQAQAKVSSPAPQQEQANQDPAVFSFLQNMQKKGFSALQIQSEIQKFIDQNSNGQQNQQQHSSPFPDFFN